MAQRTETRKLVPESRTELQRLFLLSKAEAERCPEGKAIPKVTYTASLAGTTQTWDNKVPGRYFDSFGTKILHNGSLSYQGEPQYYSINEARDGVSKVKWAWTLGERRVTVVQYVTYVFAAEHRATRQARLGGTDRTEDKAEDSTSAGDGAAGNTQDHVSGGSASPPKPPRFPTARADVQILNPENS
ncbi:hypothetical protein HWV62_482 [Athelia sp. TMB]|nr:hypothetical protein HWV62_482 [Athelia sp. TMB]